MMVLDQIGTIIDKFEGAAFTDDAADHGGATRFGVTRPFLSEYLGLPAGTLCPVDRVRDLTRDEAVHVTTELVALKTGLYRIADERLRFAVLDYGVHSGTPRAIRALQRAVGLDADGLFGRQSEWAVNHAEAGVTRDRVLAGRLAFLGRLLAHDPTQSRFAAGWLARVGAVLTWPASVTA
jgi:lysozyme family protein